VVSGGINFEGCFWFFLFLPSGEFMHLCVPSCARHLRTRFEDSDRILMVMVVGAVIVTLSDRVHGV
jgi:hypothetical protein